MGKITLNAKDLKLAHELADIFRKMDRDPRLVLYGDKERLYKEASKNPSIHYKALELNRKKQRIAR